MRITRRLSHAGAAFAAVAAVLLSSGAAAGAGPAIEVNYQNPVSALQPVSRPDTPSCTVTAMQHDFANSYGSPYVGTLTPPGALPAPWPNVVPDWTGSLAVCQTNRHPVR